MLEESYVSFETAKLLKEAGFDAPYTSQYTEEECIWDTDYLNNFNQDEFCYSRPTLALAARWLREVHHYVVCVWYTADYRKWFYAYGDMNSMAFDAEYNISDFIYDSYEEALEAGLQEAIKLIKK